MDSYVSIVSPMYPSAYPTPSDTYFQWYSYYSTLNQLPSLGSSGPSLPQLPHDPAFWSTYSSPASTSASPFNYTPVSTPSPAITPMSFNFPGSQNFWSTYSNIPTSPASSSASPFSFTPISTPPAFQPAITPMPFNFPGSQNFWSTYPSFVAIPPLTSPPAPPTQPPATPVSRPTEKKTANGEFICTNCQVTETIRWRNIRTNVLCNPCFVYERKYKKCRPTTAIQKMQARKDQAAPY